MKKIAVILAGGHGFRMWPRSGEKTPKQFNHFIGEGTMIQNTIARLFPMFAPEEIYIVMEKSHAALAEKQLPMIPEKNIILEPIGRRTAPAIALAATEANAGGPGDALMYIFPSDHVIYNVREFHNSLELAGKFAYEKKGKVTIGIPPTRPETAFGYIQEDEKTGDLGEYFEKGARKAKSFAEKPDMETAKRFINAGDFLWNSGIFIWREDTYFDGMRKYIPEHYQLFKELQGYLGSPDYDAVKDRIYAQMQSESVDYAILEKSSNVFVVRSTFSWSDLGNWDEYYRLSLKDGRNNFIEGDVIAIDTKNCLISSNERLIGAVGLEGLIVVDTKDALLICKRKNSENVKQIIDTLKRKNIRHYL